MLERLKNVFCIFNERIPNRRNCDFIKKTPEQIRCLQTVDKLEEIQFATVFFILQWKYYIT